MTKIIETAAGQVSLLRPDSMPNAGSFLWNQHLMLQLNCRGYASAQFMQPEPAKYATGPSLEATTFMQPEQSYFDHHPGRFFYVKDHSNGELISLPFAPIQKALDSFKFIVETEQISWLIHHRNLCFELVVKLDPKLTLELWSLRVRNDGDESRQVSIYPYFPIGYHSWMSQGARYHSDWAAIVAHRVSPYQKVADYYKQKQHKEWTVFMAQTPPIAWETSQSIFEGFGGLREPDSLTHNRLSNSEALYERPCAAMQYDLSLAPKQSQTFKFAFGAAANTAELEEIQTSLNGQDDDIVELAKPTFKQGTPLPSDAENVADDLLNVSTPDAYFDQFVNVWLPRQITYHADLNRLSTDPQTRNFLQDTMGLCFINPQKAKASLITALQQQNADGSMPDGILLHDDAELKYINQVPHADHGVWLPIAVQCYLRETNDFEFLDEKIVSHKTNPPQNDGNNDGEKHEQTLSQSVFERVCAAVDYLAAARNAQGLSFIAQGDWCDPMNMVGHRGVGTSAWLTLATSYAASLWAEVCTRNSARNNHSDEAIKKSIDNADKYQALAQNCSDAANKHYWHQDWYGRGLTDDGRLFGIKSDAEAKIYLNPQSWAILAGAADDQKIVKILAAIKQELSTPYGIEMLAPAYTKMQEDIGRLTQKFPGVAENGSVYNHASAFYIYSLYNIGASDQAFELLRKMIPGPDVADLLKRGQLPVFIPNYYRGAFKLHPETAGTSSQLFNTGTVHWYLRALFDGLFGLVGDYDCLRVTPQLPAVWNEARIFRQFCGAQFSCHIIRNPHLEKPQLKLDGVVQNSHIIRNIQANKHYRLELEIPQ